MIFPGAEHELDAIRPTHPFNLTMYVSACSARAVPNTSCTCTHSHSIPVSGSDTAVTQLVDLQTKPINQVIHATPMTEVLWMVCRSQTFTLL